MKAKTKYLSGFVSLSLVLFIAAGLFAGVQGILSRKQNTIAADGKEDSISIVIDPGHGGEDGGCSSEAGLLEKDLNLSISADVCAILNAAGYPTVMTRTEDTLLYDMYQDRNDYKQSSKDGGSKGTIIKDTKKFTT